MKSCCDVGEARKVWYTDKLFLIALVGSVIMGFAAFVPLLRPMFDVFLEYVGIIWWAVLLGLFLGGIMDYFVPQEYVSKMLAQKKKRTIFNAVGLGFLMSVCSHGILAIAIQLYKKGASAPAVVAFLLAAPWANITITIMLFGFFGVKALFIILSAILIAIITGFVFQFLDSKEMIERNPISVSTATFSIRGDVKRRWKKFRFSVDSVLQSIKGIGRGAVSLSQMVLWWILIGVFLASAAGAFIPVDFFRQYMGATLLGMLVTLLIATVMEVCSEGTSPMAFEIFRQTGALGNSFIFLMAGVATDMTEIGLIWKNIGRKTALWLPLVTVPQVIVVGYFLNVLL
jgi:uncharacterized membrane protein YraQ (UPF0718 family)